MCGYCYCCAYCINNPDKRPKHLNGKPELIHYIGDKEVSCICLHNDYDTNWLCETHYDESIALDAKISHEDEDTIFLDKCVNCIKK